MLIATIIILALLVVWIIASYNGMVSLREQVRSTWAQIDVALKRRHDLVPNLVETVKGYAAHESQTLEKVIAARNSAVGATNPRESAIAENSLSGALRQVFALAESYPQLKANENFLQLQNELTNTENQIGSYRGGYNDTVRRFNTTVMRFPNNLFASAFGFTSQPFFELQDAAQREAPVVKF